jgi:hypothetical protein
MLACSFINQLNCLIILQVMHVKRIDLMIY